MASQQRGNGSGSGGFRDALVYDITDTIKALPFIIAVFAVTAVIVVATDWPFSTVMYVILGVVLAVTLLWRLLRWVWRNAGSEPKRSARDDL